MIDMAFLDEQDKEIVKDEIGSCEFDGFARFWNYKSLQLDGDFSTDQIKRLSAAMLRMELVHNNLEKGIGSDNDDD